MEKKKETKGQLERKIQNALVFVPKDKEYSWIYFTDKGLRLETTSDSCVISTGFHKHVFDSFTSSGISRPFLYTKRVIEIANENLKAIEVDGGYSFQKLLEVLKAKEDKTEYNIVTLVDWWIYNCFQPLFSIGEGDSSAFFVYETYMHNMARNAVLLSEKTEDMTALNFLKEVSKNEKEFNKELQDFVLFPKKTDEELMKENIEALTQNEQEQAMKAQINGSQY
jgi:hypothetical protein